MSGSVEATTAIALMMMSSGTPASLMAVTRWPATAAKSSWLIPRSAWASSSGCEFAVPEPRSLRFGSGPLECHTRAVGGYISVVGEAY